MMIVSDCPKRRVPFNPPLYDKVRLLYAEDDDDGVKHDSDYDSQACFDKKFEEEDYKDCKTEFDDGETYFSSTPGSSIIVPSWRSLQMIRG